MCACANLYATLHSVTPIIYHCRGIQDFSLGGLVGSLNASSGVNAGSSSIMRELRMAAVVWCNDLRLYCLFIMEGPLN